MNAEKRKHVALTISQKVEILKKIDEGASIRLIAQTFGIGIRTVYDIKKNKEKLLNFYVKSDCNAGISKRKSLHEAKSAKLDAVLYEWFCQRRSEGCPITGPIIREKAKQFHKDLQIEESCDFTSGWLTSFKNRHGIRYVKGCGEKLSADTQAAEDFVDELSKLIYEEKLTADQIYNMDETGLFWRCLPRKTFLMNNEKAASGVKERKDRLTVLLCSNAAGTHKLKPLVVGKSAHPRALKQVTHLPVLYKNNKRAWITRDLTKEWFQNHFVKEARSHCNHIGLAKDCKIILLLDNCPAHPSADVLSADNVTALFLPPNTTAIFQPMDQGIINSFKCFYKSKILQFVLNADPGLKIAAVHKEINLKHCVYMLAESWSEVTQSTLINAWHNIWPESLFLENDAEENFSGFKPSQTKAKAIEFLSYARKCNSEILTEVEDEEIINWMLEDGDVPVTSGMTDEEIINSVFNSSSDSDTESEHETSEKKIKFDTGLELGDSYLKFLEQQKCVTEQEIMMIHRLQQKLKQEKNKVLIQPTIKDMFNKM